MKQSKQTDLCRECKSFSYTWDIGTEHVGCSGQISQRKCQLSHLFNELTARGKRERMPSVAPSLFSEKSEFKVLFYFTFFKDYDLTDIN